MGRRTGAPDGIIVLGESIEPISPLRTDTPVVRGAPDRIIAAAALAQRYPNARLVYTGGSANLVSNDAQGSRFRRRTVRKPRHRQIAADHGAASRNTQENAEFSKAMVKPKDGERWVMVTSAFHMPRSVGLFRKAGFEVEPYPVDWRVGGRVTYGTFQRRRRGTGAHRPCGARMDGPDRLPAHRQDR